ncbi:uncharacterized protein LOC118437003 [Folsomia candida]|nr:uncharacterized protein LOC118437003 [Folsomia candida]
MASYENTNRGNSSNLAAETNMNSGFEGQVIRKLDFLSATVNHLCDAVNLLVNRHQIEQIEYKENAFDLPISTTGAMKVVEDELKASERRGDKKQSLVFHLALGGGRKTPDSTYRVMAELMTNEIAAQFSYEGKKGKLSFCDFPLIKASVLAAVRRNVGDAKGNDIEDGIKYWLKKGPERLKREKKSNAVPGDATAEVNII